MKRYILTTILFLITPISLMFGQTFESLWKQVEHAQKEDLPKSELRILETIITKGRSQKAYGHLLCAQLRQARVQAEVSPDSLKPAIQRMADSEQKTTDIALRSVYDAILGYIYENNPLLCDDAQALSQEYYKKAMRRPEKLAQIKASTYKPLVIEGSDSHYFGDDLLSLIGYETRQFDVLHRYYLTTDNRIAQLFSGLEMLRMEGESLTAKKQIERLDSLIQRYADLTEAGEAAIERYLKMLNVSNITEQERMNYIDMSLNKWGKWKRMDILRNARKWLTNRQFNATLNEEVFIPNHEQPVKLQNLRGITSLTMRIYRVNTTADAVYGNDVSHNNTFRELKNKLTALPELTQTRHYDTHEAYEFFEDSLALPGLPVGVYVVEVETTPGTEVRRQLYFVSDVRIIMQPLPNNIRRIVTLNATTGQPIKGASVRISHQRSNTQKADKVVTITTDSHGEYLYDAEKDRELEFFAFTNTDKACPPQKTWSRFDYNPDLSKTEKGVVFTDRAIYRPGQTVHVAAIIYQVTDGYKHQAVKDRQLTAELRDANWQEVSQKKVHTDPFGTCAADFVLPTSALTGRYSVKVGNYTGYFRVEEYKRPTFQVEFQKVERDYAAGDTIAARASVHSYAGVPVQNAHVRYKVVRRRAFWWATYSRYWMSGILGNGTEEAVMATGETKTADDGTFAVSMPMILPETPYPMFYSFAVTADVTDLAGETHRGEMSLPLGNRKSALTTTLPDQVQAERMPEMSFNLRNAAGNDIDAVVMYQIDGGKWLSAKTGAAISLPRLTSGEHKLNATCASEGVTPLEQTFVVFSENDKRPATKTDDWFWQSAGQFPNDGSPVTVQVGSSNRDMHIVYSILSGDKVLESGAVDKSGELINRKLTYKPSYDNGLLLTFVWVKNGKVYQHSAQIIRPLPDKQLKLQWTTFRDRLTPGQQETWTLSITKPDGSPADAQLMATLYDKSLDQITGHDWQFAPFTNLTLPYTYWHAATWNQLNWNGSQQQIYASVSDLQFNTFDHDCYPSSWRMANRLYRLRRGSANEQLVLREASVMPQVAMPAMNGASEESLQGKIAGLDMKKSKTDVADESMTEGLQEHVQMRENLQETAFFYPQLATNDKGHVELAFTLPESLTTWRLLGLGHTADMMYGSIQAEAVAKKDVMIQPNMPRFLRMGDQATLSARIFNTSDQPRGGQVRLQLIVPESGRVVYDQQQTVSLEANGQASTTFDMVPDQQEHETLLICRWTISGEGFSDGEQHYLPILPDQERVTVTLPFTQKGPETKTINLQSLVPHTAHAANYTIEYTNNPTWLMVQALPSIGHTNDDNAISLGASLYANRLGRHFMELNPEVKDVIEHWRREQGETTSLQSDLTKNQELKDILLNETPWVIDAQNESEQKQMLSSFFDQNAMKQRISSATAKLERLQNGDGSWSWWEGMRGSTYMTISVSEMLVRLHQMTGQQDDDTRLMLDKAFRFLGREMTDMVRQMKEDEKKGVKPSFPSHMALEWLYICAIDGRILPTDVSKANDYLKKLLKKDIKNQTIYEKALSAIVLNSATYIKSLKEWTVYNEEMGRYYDTQRATYSWRSYRIPTQVAAIEALQRLTPNDQQTIEEMQRWLLQEKRTTCWDTPLSSIDAVYAFFAPGTAFSLTTQGAPTTFSLNGQPLSTPSATAGIGYVKTAIPSTGANRNDVLAIENTSTRTSWGVVYAQFMQHTADVEDQKSGLGVQREIIAPSTSTGLTGLKVGDRIKVRITIDADRDYDFVQIQDRRAACFEPTSQLSGYHNGYYCTPKDNATNYYFDVLRKGRHIIETEYYIDRAGRYETGTCSVQCAYSPGFRGITKSQTIIIE